MCWHDFTEIIRQQWITGSCRDVTKPVSDMAGRQISLCLPILRIFHGMGDAELPQPKKMGGTIEPDLNPPRHVGPRSSGSLPRICQSWTLCESVEIREWYTAMRNLWGLQTARWKQVASFINLVFLPSLPILRSVSLELWEHVGLSWWCKFLEGEFSGNPYDVQRNASVMKVNLDLNEEVEILKIGNQYLF